MGLVRWLSAWVRLCSSCGITCLQYYIVEIHCDSGALSSACLTRAVQFQIRLCSFTSRIGDTWPRGLLSLSSRLGIFRGKVIAMMEIVLFVDWRWKAERIHKQKRCLVNACHCVSCDLEILLIISSTTERYTCMPFERQLFLSRMATNSMLTLTQMDGDTQYSNINNVFKHVVLILDDLLAEHMTWWSVLSGNLQDEIM